MRKRRPSPHPTHYPPAYDFALPPPPPATASITPGGLVNHTAEAPPPPPATDCVVDPAVDALVMINCPGLSWNVMENEAPNPPAMFVLVNDPPDAPPKPMTTDTQLLVVQYCCADTAATGAMPGVSAPLNGGVAVGELVRLPDTLGVDDWEGVDELVPAEVADEDPVGEAVADRDGVLDCVSAAVVDPDGVVLGEMPEEGAGELVGNAVELLEDDPVPLLVVLGEADVVGREDVAAGEPVAAGVPVRDDVEAGELVGDDVDAGVDVATPVGVPVTGGVFDGVPVPAGVDVGVMLEHADADSRLTNPPTEPNKAVPPPVGEFSQKLLL